MASTTKKRLAIINKSSSVLTEELFKVVQAINRQLEEDFAPIWNRSLDLFSTITLPSENTWKLILWDDIKIPGALGKREPTHDAQVFLNACRSNWTEVLSHEILEMCGNPELNLYVRKGFDLIPYDVCDAVQGSYYLIDGVKVSNFVYPNYFVPNSKGPFDKLNLIKQPFELLESGYATVSQLEYVKKDRYR